MISLSASNKKVDTASQQKHPVCKNTPMSAKDMQKASVTALKDMCSGGTGSSQKEEWVGMMPGCRKKGLDHVLLRVLQCPTLWFPSPERKAQAMITEVMLQLCLASPCKVDSWCASKQTIMKDKSNLSSLMRPNGLTLWGSLSQHSKTLYSISYRQLPASAFSFLWKEGSFHPFPLQVPFIC